MDDIASHLGMSKKTIYNHVSNKTELLELMMKQYLEAERDTCACSSQETDNAIDQLIKIFEFNVNSIRHINQAFVYDLKKYYPQVWSLFEQHKAEVIEQAVRANIQFGQTEGLYRKEINPLIISKLYSNRLDMILDGEVFPMTEFSFKDVVTEMLIYHLRGIASQAGLAHLDSLKIAF
jgi:AcrR family transcriptional regulator